MSGIGVSRGLRRAAGWLVMVAGTGALVLAAACGTEEAAGCPPLALAFMGPLSGPDAATGEVVRNAAALAVEEHNAAANKCDVGLVSFDTRGESQRAGGLARQVVADTQVVGVVGPVFSGETGEVMPIFEEADLPVVTPSATNPGLGQQGWRTFHRLVGTDASQGPAAARWLVEQAGATTVAVVDDGTLYGRGLADVVAEDLDRRGATIAPRQRVEPERRDYGDVVAEVNSVGADAVFFGGLAEAGVQLYRQLRGAGIDVLFAAGDGMFVEAFSQAVDGAEEAGGAGVVVTCPCSGVATTAAQRAFATRFVDAFGRQPFNFAAEGFDAAGMLLRGIDEGATTRPAMVTWLSDASYQGITKRVSFDAAGEVVDGPVFFFGVDDGSFVLTGQQANGRLVDLTPG